VCVLVDTSRRQLDADSTDACIPGKASTAYDADATAHATAGRGASYRPVWAFLNQSSIRPDAIAMASYQTPSQARPPPLPYLKRPPPALPPQPHQPNYQHRRSQGWDRAPASAPRSSGSGGYALEGWGARRDANQQIHAIHANASRYDRGDRGARWDARKPISPRAPSGGRPSEEPWGAPQVRRVARSAAAALYKSVFTEIL
jgi:hypothetical protein